MIVDLSSSNYFFTNKVWQVSEVEDQDQTGKKGNWLGHPVTRRKDDLRPWEENVHQEKKYLWVLAQNKQKAKPTSIILQKYNYTLYSKRFGASSVMGRFTHSHSCTKDMFILLSQGSKGMVQAHLIYLLLVCTQNPERRKCSCSMGTCANTFKISVSSNRKQQQKGTQSDSVTKGKGKGKMGTNPGYQPKEQGEQK